MKQPSSTLPQSTPDRSPPHSAEAEEHVIACCLLDGSDTISRAVVAGVREESFYYPANRLLWEVLLAVYTKKFSVSLETLAEELKERRQIEAVGGFAYLMQVTGKIPTTAHAGYFIEKVLEKQYLRETIRCATGMVEKSYNYSGGGIAENMAESMRELTAIQNGVSYKDERGLKQASENTIKLVEAMSRGEKSTEQLIPWGFSDFDRVFHPITPGELVVIAARPSVGKTTLSDQIAIANAFQGNDVAIFSLEVTVDQKPRKFAQIMSGHSWRTLPMAHEQDRVEFLQKLKEVRDCTNLYCYYREQSIEGICARIRVLHQQKKLKLAIIDYLQLLHLPKNNSRNDAIGDATRALKLLALELGIPILLMSQLNRSSERENREPRLSDLRDSGNIEQDADRIIFIHRPPVDPITQMPQSITDGDRETYYQDVIQAKGRDVGTNRVGMYFKAACTTFTSISRNAAAN